MQSGIFYSAYISIPWVFTYKQIFTIHKLHQFIFLVTSYDMETTFGSIHVPRMIWTQTLLILGSLIYCYMNCTSTTAGLPSVVQISETYPNSVVFRIGMLYSLFIMYLLILFISWWIQSANEMSTVRSSLFKTQWVGLVAVVAYGLFASTIDNKFTNLDLVKDFVFIATIAFFVLVQSFNKNIKKIRKTHKGFISRKSWKIKNVLGLANLGIFVAAVLIYLGQLDISHKDMLEYLMIADVTLYFMSFTLDFKKNTMGIQMDDWSAGATVDYQVQHSLLTR